MGGKPPQLVKLVVRIRKKCIYLLAQHGKKNWSNNSDPIIAKKKITPLYFTSFRKVNSCMHLGSNLKQLSIL